MSQEQIWVFMLKLPYAENLEIVSVKTHSYR